MIPHSSPITYSRYQRCSVWINSTVGHKYLNIESTTGPRTLWLYKYYIWTALIQWYDINFACQHNLWFQDINGVRWRLIGKHGPFFTTLLLGTDNLPIKFLGHAASNGMPQPSRRNIHIYLWHGATFALRPCHCVPCGIVWTYLNVYRFATYILNDVDMQYYRYAQYILRSSIYIVKVRT